MPLIAPSVPPLTTTSPLVPSQLNVAPGSSLNVNVIVALWPALTLALSLLIAIVGTTVSTAIVTALFASDPSAF